MRRIRTLFLLAAASPLFAEEPVVPIVVESDHYRLTMEGERQKAEEYSRLLEAAWKQWQAYFGKKPKLKKSEKLDVRYFKTREPWAAAIQRDGGKPPDGAGGYYWPPAKTAYLYTQPTDYYTRTLLLHEAGHQFHFLACTRNKEPAVGWYTEAVAEYLAAHMWDGSTLKLGVLPTISLNDYAGKALAAVKAPGFDLTKFVETAGADQRPIGWALYRYLVTGNGGKPFKRAKDFKRKMDGGVTPGPIFKKCFGKPAKVQPEFVKWLEKSQEPWEQVFVEWQGVGPGRMRATSKVVSICRLKQAPKVLEATLLVPPRGKRWLGGILVHYSSKDDFTVCLLDWGGHIRIQRRKGKGWQILERGPGPGVGDDGNYHFQAFRKGGNVYLQIGLLSYGPWELPGSALGLAIQDCTLEFKDVTWK